MLLLSSLEELIPEDHLMRVMNLVINEINIGSLMPKYKGREECLPSSDDAESMGVGLHSTDLLVKTDPQGLKGECDLHVDQREKSAGLSEHQRISRLADQGRD